MKNLILIATLIFGAQAQAMYSAKVTPLYRCTLVQHVADNDLTVVLSKSTFGDRFALTTTKSLIDGAHSDTVLVEAVPAISELLVFQGDDVALSIDLMCDSDQAFNAQINFDGGRIENLNCLPVRKLLNLGQ